MSCDQYDNQLNALLDGELPAAEAATLAAHIATCPACARGLAELAALRAGLAQMLPEQDAPPALQARIEAMLQGDAAEIIADIIPFKKPRRLQAGWLAATALAAALVLALMPHHDVTKDLVSVHDAALRSGGLEANAVLAPRAVPGFQLTGNRMDEVAGHVAEVADYTRDGQKFTLCIWPANGEKAHGVKHAQYRGMEIAYWNDGTNEFWAASAGPRAGLQAFIAGLLPG